LIPEADPLTILVPKFCDLRHQKISDLLVRTKRISLPVKSAEIDRSAEPDTHFLTPGPVPQYLLWKIIAQARYENGNDLRISILDHLADTWLCGQEAVRVPAEIALPLRMKSDYMSVTFAGKPR